jgi:hypothetical protein
MPAVPSPFASLTAYWRPFGGEDFERGAKLMGTAMHDSNSHSRAGATPRFDTGNAGAIVPYRQVERSAAGAQRMTIFGAPAMTRRIVGKCCVIR